jgi:hypothetical protein
MTTVTVSIKLLSGDLLSLAIPDYMTRRAFYGYVYQQLPDDVAPEEDYMLSLVRSLSEEELPADNECLGPQEGEMFFAFLDTRTFAVDMRGAWWETYDTRVPTPRMFCQWEYTVYKTEHGHKSQYFTERFYYNEDEMSWLVADRLRSERVGRRGEEEEIHIPDGEPLYSSMEHIASVMVERIPGLSRRAMTHIQDNLVWMWNDMNVAPMWNEAEQEPEPYHENLPEEPLGVHREEWA